MGQYVCVLCLCTSPSSKIIPPVHTQTAACSALVHPPDDASFTISKDAQDNVVSIIATVTGRLTRAVLLNDTVSAGVLVQTLQNNGLGNAMLKTGCLGL